MSRSYAKGKKPRPGANKKPNTVQVSWNLTAPIRWILSRPRAIRFLLVALFSLAVTLAIFPIVDAVYLQFLFNESTRILPSFVSAALGIITYMFGWRLVIGTVGETPPVRSAVFWYLVVGILAIVLVSVLILQGYSIGTAPDQ